VTIDVSASPIPVGPGPGRDAAAPDATGSEGVAAVTLDAGAPPDRAAHVRLPEWEGPLGLLLALIEARQLDILTVPLGSLAGAYLEALAVLPADRLVHVSAFVTVASQLILIKSRALLPRRESLPPTGLPDEGVDPEAELRARLLLYRAYRDAGDALAAIALDRHGLFRREPGAAAAAAVAGARPADSPPLDPTTLVDALAAFAQVAPPPPLPPETIPRSVTLADRAAIIRRAIADAGIVVLQELLVGVRDRVVVAVTFLAMLELMKRREIVVEQAEPWGPIVARATTDEERIAAGVAIDVDQAPLDERLESFA
jgi:segregation and condensation protein A